MIIKPPGDWKQREISVGQLDYLKGLSDENNLSRQDFLTIATRVTGRFIGDITNLKMGEASDLINYLKEMKQ